MGKQMEALTTERRRLPAVVNSSGRSLASVSQLEWREGGLIEGCWLARFVS